MPRTKYKKKRRRQPVDVVVDRDIRFADLLCCADVHLRESAPACRQDDFYAAMLGKLALLSRLQRRFACPVVIAGDLFHTWKCSHWLTRLALECLPDNVLLVAGQHELPGHRVDMIDRSPLSVLTAAGRVRMLTPKPIVIRTPHRYTIAGAAFGQEEEAEKRKGDVLVLHKFVWHQQRPYPGAPNNAEARRVLARFPGFKVVVCGDNHEAFAYRHEGRLLVNCGAMMRTRIDQQDFQPVFWAWTKRRNEVRQIPIHVDQGAVTTEHVKNTETADRMFDKFLRQVRNVQSKGISFADNLVRFLRANPQRKGVESILREAIDK